MPKENYKMVCGGGDVSGHKEDFPDFHQARTSEGQDRKPRIPGDGGRGGGFVYIVIAQ